MITIEDHAPLDGLNTFGLPSRCRRLVTFTCPDDLPRVAEAVEGSEAAILGGGSNVLLPPCLDLTVVRCADRSVTADFLCGAGAALDSVVATSCEGAHPDLAPLSGIPGTVGGAVVQNAGAYGMEIGRAVASVHVYDLRKRKRLLFDNMDCGFSYRSSVFKTLEQGRYLIYRVQLAFSQETPCQTRRRILQTRAAKLPDTSETGSAGSYFQNPCVSPEQFHRLLSVAGPDMPHWPLPDGSVKLSAAWLIDQAGWKGHTRGNVRVWPTQALVLTNATGRATLREVEELEQMIARSVESRFGVRLVPEVIKLGSSDAPRQSEP